MNVSDLPGLLFPLTVGVQVLPMLTTSPLSPRKSRDPTPTEPKQTMSPPKNKRRWRKHPPVGPSPPIGKEQNFSLCGICAFEYDKNLIISDIHELQLLDEFLAKKVHVHCQVLWFRVQSMVHVLPCKFV